jgi:hypothetical protein
MTINPMALIGVRQADSLDRQEARQLGDAPDGDDGDDPAFSCSRCAYNGEIT